MISNYKILLLSLFLLASCTNFLNKEAVNNTVTFQHYPNFKSKYVDPRNIDIMLPPEYDANRGTSYPVLVMHDGQMLFDSTTTWNHQEWKVDEAIEKLAKQGAIEPCIVVAVWNTPKRFAEYMPQKPVAMLPDSLQSVLRQYSKDAIQSDNYLRFLTEELLPFVKKNYRVKPGMEHCFIMGSSMGGLISLYAICEYPNVFGGAACLSTHWSVAFDNNHPIFPNTLIEYFANHLPDPKSHKIYFDHGTATLDSLYQSHQMRMDSCMQQHGYVRDVNWVSKEFPGADHSEKSWAARLEVPLQFLLGNKN